MRCAILADIHSNYMALMAVLDEISAKGGVDEVWCLGDIVGYGPEPTECINLLKMVDAACVSGNHDLGAAGKLDLALFNPLAAQVCKWTAEHISTTDLLYLSELPSTLKKGDFTLVHGSPKDPALEYILSATIAQRNFEAFETQYCLAGHTHVPVAYKQEKELASAVSLHPGIGLVMIEHRIIINPGAVGQPRDGDPRASYGIYDSEGQIFRLYRVDYDIRTTQDKMMEAGLPVPLIARLEKGK
jgi:diadenosine tetraphosphatase ApaH/serine/threonine PP2A family protein phosphatase